MTTHTFTVTVPAALRRLHEAVDPVLRALLPSRVVAIRCPACRTWVKPRHYRTPANLCRDCVSLTQTTVHFGHPSTVHHGGRR
jgi:hypothetical protein